MGEEEGRSRATEEGYGRIPMMRNSRRRQPQRRRVGACREIATAVLLRDVVRRETCHVVPLSLGALLLAAPGFLPLVFPCTIPLLFGLMRPLIILPPIGRVHPTAQCILHP